LWICFNDYLQGNNGGVAGGLWKISGAHSEGLKDLQLSWKGSVATKYDIRGRRWKGLYGAVIAFGAPRKAGDYPALYAYGAGLLTEFDGENKVYASYNGFLRSDDSANNWVDISDPEGRKFGGLGNSGKIYPSPTVYGEIYHGTPGRGVVYAFTPEVATTQLGASPSRHTPPIGLQAQVRHGFLSIRIPSSLESSSQNLQVRLTNAQGKSRILALPAISQGDTEQQFLVSKLGLQGILSVQLLRNQQIVATTKTIVF
jgi:hypothetical protein